jgi:hypothetical protein
MRTARQGKKRLSPAALKRVQLCIFAILALLIAIYIGTRSPATIGSAAKGRSSSSR